MTYCLWCNEESIIQTTWENVFLPKVQNVCNCCKERFETIEGNACRKCWRIGTDAICSDCNAWEKLYGGKDVLKKNISVYMYNSFMKEVIARWKYQGDYALGEMFREHFFSRFEKEFANVKEALIVPIPLSKQRSYERGFNQARQLAAFLPPAVSDMMERRHSEKQSKKSKVARMTTRNPFSLDKTINKPAILVDDIYTTGRTIRHAAALLKQKGCPEVYAYTLIRG